MRKCLLAWTLLLTLILVAGCSSTEEAATNESQSISKSKEDTVETDGNTTTVPIVEAQPTETIGEDSAVQATVATEPTIVVKPTSTTVVSEQTIVEKSTSTTIATESKTTIVSTIASTAGRISREEAKKIALKRFDVAERDISRYEIELDYDDDARRWEYEIGFYIDSTEYDVEIDAVSGAVIRAEKETKRQPSGATTTITTTKVTTTVNKNASISKAEAKVIALDRAGVTEENISRFEIELDYDDDARRWEYEISFNVGRAEYDITIDGTTGKILEFEKEVD